MNKKTIDQLDLNGKKVLLRVDFNVPMKDGVVQDDNRINMELPTIKKVIAEGGKAIIFSHLGRIASEEDFAKGNIEPVAKVLAEKLGQDVKFVNATRGAELEAAIDALENGQVLMFQNTRYEDADGKKESKNDPELGKYWASLGDVFINDAFGTAHRAHASNVGISSNIAESAVGYLMQTELEKLGKVISNPEKPMVVIMGGAKVSDKIGLINNFVEFADKIVAGGGMATTFTKAQGFTIGDSLVEEDFVPVAKELLEKHGDKIIVPVDFALASGFKDEPRVVTEDANVPDGKMALDIGPKSNDLIREALKGAKTIVWNGPMGVTEFKNFAEGTAVLCEDIAKEDSYSVIGGGDSAAAAIKLGFADKFSHISTGGGASMELLEGKPLPAIEAIQDA